MSRSPASIPALIALVAILGATWPKPVQSLRCYSSGRARQRRCIHMHTGPAKAAPDGFRKPIRNHRIGSI